MRNRLNNEQYQFGSDLCSFFKLICYRGMMAVLVMAMFVMLAMFRISSFTTKTYESYKEIPYNRVGLLLGTSPTIAPGQDNLYFSYRIMAAVELFNAGKIKYILVSGDNRHDSYNEPRMMYKALIKQGIPAENIVMDFAGINTLNSVVRAKEVFLLKDVTVISQSWHNERAIFIADKFGINAVGFNASEPDGFGTFKVKLREIGARIKCVFDIYLFDTKAHFLGEPIPIGSTPMPKQPSAKPKHNTSKPKQPSMSKYGIREQLEYEALKQIAKQPTDSARYIYSIEMANQTEQLRSEREQEALLREEQNEALIEASQNAANSLNQDLNSLNETDEGTTQAQPENITPKVEDSGVNAAPRTTPRRTSRPANRISHGDPWD